MEGKKAIIDLALGAQLIGGDEAAAKEILALLVTTLPEHQQELTHAFAAGDTEALRKSAHKLHGGTCYTGTPALKDAAAALESAAKTTHDINALKPLYEHLLESIQAVIDAANP